MLESTPPSSETTVRAAVSIGPPEVLWPKKEPRENEGRRNKTTNVREGLRL